MQWRAASFEVLCTVGDVSVQRAGQKGCTCGVARRMEERCFLGSIGRSPIDTLSSSSCREGNQTAVSAVRMCTAQDLPLQGGARSHLDQNCGVCKRRSMRRCALASSTGSSFSVVISAMSVRSLGPSETPTPFVAGGAAHNTFGLLRPDFQAQSRCTHRTALQGALPTLPGHQHGYLGAVSAVLGVQAQAALAV